MTFRKRKKIKKRQIGIRYLSDGRNRFPSSCTKKSPPVVTLGSEEEAIGGGEIPSV
jgi:hypothetical protein